MNYKITSDKDIVEKYQKELGGGSWPEFMQHDPIVEKYWDTLYSRYSTFQFAVFDNNEIVGIGNTIPVHWDNPFSELPDEGMDWAFEKANSDYLNNVEPNLVVAAQILINKEYRGKGISSEMAKIMKDVACNNGFKHIALPIRPTLKHRFPLIPMREYMLWENDNGEAFDPWIRVHKKIGGQLVGACNHSMEITGTPENWEKWTGLKFPGSGNYVVSEALSIVNIDKESNIGTYIEPNVWMVHNTNLSTSD